MPVPIVYRKSPDVSATYDFFDLLNLIGYKNFYPAKCLSGQNIVVGDATFQSEATYNLSGAGTLPTFATYQINDREIFDLEFNTPQNLKGDVFLNIPMTQKAGGAGKEIYSYVSAAIFKYDGSEHEIGISGNSLPIYCAANTTQTNTTAIKITLSGVTHFKAGDKVRVKEYILSTSSSAVTGATDAELSLNYDPSTAASKQTWFLPFKVDL